MCVGVAQAVWAVAVLQHFAGDHAQTAFIGLGHEHVDRFRVSGGKAQRGGHAVAHQLVQKKCTHFTRVGRVGELFFVRKGVVRQPGQQALGWRTDDIGLRVVGMQIDKAGRDAQARPVGDGQIGKLQGQFAPGADGLDAHDAVGLAGGDEQPVGFVPGLGALWLRKPQQSRTPALQMGNRGNGRHGRSIQVKLIGI